MSEEEIIDILQNIICDEVIGTYCIKIQEEIDCSENCKDDDCYLIKAVDGIIDLYKNLKAIEQEHKKINGELREEIKREKEKNEKLEMEFSLGLIGKEEEIKSNMSEIIEEYYISKDKIREKIEEVKSLENASIADILESEKEFCIDILEELL